MRLRALLALLLGIALLVPAAPAGAHAELDTAVPVPDEVATSLDELVLTFFGGVSQVTVVMTDPGGELVTLGGPELRGPSEARIPVDDGDLPAGVYRVDWAAVSADDGFPANGAFSFTYEPSASSGSPLRTVAVLALPVLAVAGVLWWLRKPAPKKAGAKAAKPARK
jgi:methionine-rich copper-binding protein CopC